MNDRFNYKDVVLSLEMFAVSWPVQMILLYPSLVVSGGEPNSHVRCDCQDDLFNDVVSCEVRCVCGC
jgi:hypothetical protein